MFTPFTFSWKLDRSLKKRSSTILTYHKLRSVACSVCQPFGACGLQTRLQAQGAGRLYQEACEMEDPRSYKVEDLLEKYDILPLHLLGMQMPY